MSARRSRAPSRVGKSGMRHRTWHAIPGGCTDATSSLTGHQGMQERQPQGFMGAAPAPICTSSGRQGVPGLAPAPALLAPPSLHLPYRRPFAPCWHGSCRDTHRNPPQPTACPEKPCAAPCRHARPARPRTLAASQVAAESRRGARCLDMKTPRRSQWTAGARVEGRGRRRGQGLLTAR